MTTGPTQVPGVAAMGRHSALERRRRTVALASNATDRLSDDLRPLRVAREFDAVFNSSTMGLAKPDQRVFIHIADALGVSPSRGLFVDDTPANVVAAAKAGLSAHQYRSPEDLITFSETA